MGHTYTPLHACHISIHTIIPCMSHIHTYHTYNAYMYATYTYIHTYISHMQQWDVSCVASMHGVILTTYSYTDRCLSRERYSAVYVKPFVVKPQHCVKAVKNLVMTSADKMYVADHVIYAGRNSTAVVFVARVCGAWACSWTGIKTKIQTPPQIKEERHRM